LAGSARSKKTPLVAVISFAAGIGSTVIGNYFTENLKAKLDEAKVLRASRSALWSATALHFAQYITNWDRLRLYVLKDVDPVMVGPEQCEELVKKRDLDKTTVDRYAQERDKAKDLLWADLEQARYVFGEETRAAIRKFEEFRKKHVIASACRLPTADALRDIQRSVLNAMLNEEDSQPKKGTK
jgi:hypothetical protein